MSEQDSSGFYEVRLVQERTGDGFLWTAEHPQLLGCHAVATDPQSAIDDLSRAREEWLERARAMGRRVPTPHPSLVYSLVLAAEHSVADAQSAGIAIQTTGEIVPSIHMPGLQFRA